ncbi:unnamed protein product [Owenia fusiformis]|uniref:Uncharacterized protein n=1 Tax=Owenia fusiformis TaxID=6347 RepID=A0A8J1XYN8_OWEFU|nr:unnamed protein product [Owenia fusiformis]
MWTVLLIQALVGYAASQSFIRPEKVQLDPAQEVACELTGLISDPIDCCHFIKCDLRQVGWRFPCLGKTVWNPVLCSCVPEKTFRECNRSACPPLPTPGTTAPCPIDLGTEECCLEGTGQIFRRDATNDTRYFFKGEADPQDCPPGQTFILSSCCCEGPLDIVDSPCIQFDFEGNYVDTFQSVHGTPIGTTIARPGHAGNGAAQFGTGTSVEIPYFSNAYYGIRFSASAYVRFDEQSDGLVIHNGKEEGVAATVKMEILQCPGQTVLVAGVKACDRIEDVVLPITANNGEWIKVYMSFNEGNMVVGYEDSNGVPTEVERFEPEPMPTEEIKKFVTQVNNVARRRVNVAMDAIQSIPTPVESADQAILRDVETCLDEVNSILEDLGDFTENPAGAVGLTDLRQCVKDLKPFLRRCKKGKSIDTTELEQLVTGCKEQLAKMNSIISEVKRALAKICEIKEDRHTFRDVLNKETRSSINTLKRKLNKVADAVSEENPDSGRGIGELDENVELAEECVNKQNSNRRKRNVDNDEIPSIKSTKYPLTFGDGFPGALDEVELCFTL